MNTSKFCLQSLTIGQLLICNRFGLDIEVPGATILSTFGFDSLAYWKDTLGLGVFTTAFIILAYMAMHFLLVEKR